jgi:hypothetical protein
MSSRVVSVQLDEQRIRKARELRVAGISLSSLVGVAIDRQYELLVASSRPRDVEAVMKQIYDRYPDPPDFPPRPYDVQDRFAARNAILGTLRRKRE